MHLLLNRVMLVMANDPVKKKLDFHGLNVAIEWPKGSTRKWEGSDNKKKMYADYGYIRNTDGEDGEEIDVYIGPDKDAEFIYKISQMTAPGDYEAGEDGKEPYEFDEYKYMLNYSSEDDAKEGYLKHMTEDNLGDVEQILVDDFVKSVKKHKTAVLEGEDMLTFRSGDDLYSYCTYCEKSARTPLTGVLGCTAGDEPDVIEFSNQVDELKVDPEETKCPGFVMMGFETDDGTPTVLSSTKNRKVNSGLIKEVPDSVIPDGIPNHEIYWAEVLEDSLDKLESESEEDLPLIKTIERATKELLKDDRSSTRDPEQDYNYGRVDNYPNGRLEAILAASNEVSDPQGKEAFFGVLDSAGINEVQNPTERMRLITKALVNWSGNETAPFITSDLVEKLMADYELRS